MVVTWKRVCGAEIPLSDVQTIFFQTNQRNNDNIIALFWFLFHVSLEYVTITIILTQRAQATLLITCVDSNRWYHPLFR